ncbi:MAG TPA: hypothetical protein VKC59_01565, partial [Candidatus Limnocylindrales bacterium]|nr:hypothetical protein [Candidatus Limnocylindrales bacterium]
IVSARCQPCHSLHPTEPGFTGPPAGVAFDTPAEIRARAAQIQQLAVSSTVMPLGNQTNMTAAERTELGQWIAQGSNIK